MNHQAVRDDLAPEPILEARGLTRSFGAVKALSDVSLSVRPGEILAIAGDNGAGKSTTIKILSGIVQPDGGELLFDGVPVELRNPNDAARLGIQTIYQDLALCDNLSVVENLFLGRELRTSWLRGRRLARAAMEERTWAAINSLGVRIKDIRQPVADLSGGQRQCAAICRALVGDPRVVLLDEPTAALGVTQREEVLQLILRLKEQGRAVIVISHDLAEVLTFVDRIAVLRIGSVVADAPVGEWTHDSLVGAITGNSRLRARPPSTPEPGSSPSAIPTVQPMEAGL